MGSVIVLETHQTCRLCVAIGKRRSNVLDFRICGYQGNVGSARPFVRNFIILS